MKGYLVDPDEDWPHDYHICAVDKWSLPGVTCPGCGFTGGSVGVRYPSLTLPEDLDPAPYLETWPVTPKRLNELRAPLLQRWGKDFPLPAGAGFGPLVGKGSGKSGDVGWARYNMLLTASAEQRLRKFGVTSLRLAQTEIRWRSPRAPDYFEVEIAAIARFSPSWIQRLRLFDGALRCLVCGFLRPKSRELTKRKDRLAFEELSYSPILHAPSLPPNWDLLRVQGYEATIVASEHFRRATLEAEQNEYLVSGDCC